MDETGGEEETGKGSRALAYGVHVLTALGAWLTPTVTVDLPSPAGVGLMPVTSTSRPGGALRATTSGLIFAL